MQNYYDYLTKYSEGKLGKKVAIFDGANKLTYKNLKIQVDKMIAYLQAKGVKENDHIAIIMSNCKEYLILYFAITALRAIAVPISTLLKYEEYLYAIKDSDAKLIIASDSLKEAMKLKPFFARVFITHSESNSDDDRNLQSYENYEPLKNFECKAKKRDIAHIIYTSGTTNLPKAVLLSYVNIFSNINNIQADFKINSNDRFIVYLPMFHSYTLTASCLMPLLLHSSIVIQKSLMPLKELFQQIIFKRVSVIFSIPAVLDTFSKLKFPWYFRFFHKIRIIVSGSSALSENTYYAIKKQFKKVALLQGYGLSECSPIVSVNRLEEQRINSVGKAMRDYTVKIVDDDGNEVPRNSIGELLVKGDCIMQGYYKNEEESENAFINEWLRTGDLGYMDEDDFIYLIDRKKDIIISKGINIYPSEIENVTMQLDGVENCAAIGKADDELNEIVLLFVCLKKSAKLSSSDILAHLKRHLANYKLPRQIIFKDELPINQAGKVIKKELKKELNLERN